MNHLGSIRNNIEQLLIRAASESDRGMVLDIAPQIHEGAAKYFKNCILHTLDILEEFNPTFVADICSNSSEIIPDETYDTIICTEVLEHVYRPQDAVNEMYRMLKSGGVLYGSTPFDLGVHPPSPDLWRFTDQGLSYLFSQFSSVEIAALPNVNRPFMPIQYTFKCVK